MKKLAWAAGILLLLSIIFPNGLPAVVTIKPTPTPVNPVPTPAPAPAPAEKDPKIVEILTGASASDRSRIADVYTAMGVVARRDRTKGGRLNTTEKWEDYQAHVLNLAIDTPGKYPGLDAAIEAVFARKVGTMDVLAITDEVAERLAAACDTIAASAR